MRVLVVEDDKKIASFIKQGLQEESYNVDVTYHGDEAIYLAQVNKYDIILLDIMIPGTDGLNVCRILRDKEITSSIIMLTAKDKLENKVYGLDNGADDYLTKPFDFEELLARIRAQLRKKTTNLGVVKISDLEIDMNRRSVKRDDKKIILTIKEYALLELLARNKDKILTETIIKENLSDMTQDTMSNIISVYIYRLRNKIDKEYEKKLIHTVRGSGYMLSEEYV